MEASKFERIVSRMEDLNGRSPEAYRSKVARFTSFGFGVYIGAFAIVIVAISIIIWLMVTVGVRGGSIRLLIIFGFLALVFIRSMWIKVDAPEGREITAAEAPDLMADLERIRTQIGAPPIYKVLINDDFNAFASSSPKFGIFGERCYVVLGLPLLMTQKPDEVAATIGHELAHHSRSHVKSGNRAYRLEAMWHTLLFQLKDSGSLLTYPMLWFVNWYSPRYSAMTLVLRRQAEYEADELGAVASSKQAMAIGLLRMRLDYEHRLMPYSKSIWTMVQNTAEPPKNFYQGLAEFPRQEGEEVKETLRRSLLAETVFEDSHPCVRERTEALGIPADPNRPEDVEALYAALGHVDESAADRYLGSFQEALLQEFNGAWVRENSREWNESREHFIESRDKLGKFGETDPLSMQSKEAYDYVLAYAGVHGVDESVGLAKSLADKHADSADIQYLAGRGLLDLDDEQGISYLERAVQIDSDYAAPMHDAIAQYRHKLGDSMAARAAAMQAEEHGEKISEAYEKLADLKPSDLFLETEIKQQTLDDVAARLPRMERAIEAHAIRKAHPERPNIKLDIVAVVVKMPGFVSNKDDFLADQAEQAGTIIDNANLLIFTILNNSAMGKRLLNDPTYRFYKSPTKG